MIEARTWLPAGASPDKAEAALTRMVAIWSSHWFAGSEEPRTARFGRADEAGRDLRNIGWHRCDTGAAVGIGAGGTIALGARAMGVASDIGDRTAADLALLRQLGEECLQDLRKRVQTLLDLESSLQWRETPQAPAPDAMIVRSELGSRGDVVQLAIAMTSWQLARLIRSCLPTVPELPQLATAQAALAGAELRLSAMLGGCELTLAEVEALAPGDVLVLDHLVDRAMPLAIEYRVAGRGTCIVAGAGEHLGLQLTQALVG
jgi:flagellar motor switch/type III secretory pathway protein FliN